MLSHKMGQRHLRNKTNNKNRHLNHIIVSYQNSMDTNFKIFQGKMGRQREVGKLVIYKGMKIILKAQLFLAKLSNRNREVASKF